MSLEALFVEQTHKNGMEARDGNEDPLHGPSDLSSSRLSLSAHMSKEVPSIFLSHCLL